MLGRKLLETESASQIAKILGRTPLWSEIVARAKGSINPACLRTLRRAGSDRIMEDSRAGLLNENTPI